MNPVRFKPLPEQVPVLLTGGGRFIDPVRALKELFERDPVPEHLWASTPLFRGRDGAAFSTRVL